MNEEYSALAARADACGYELKLALKPKDAMWFGIVDGKLLRLVESPADDGDLAACIADIDVYLDAVESERRFRARWAGRESHE